MGELTKDVGAGATMTLSERRRARDMSLGELARKVNLGSAVMSRIERGRETPPDAIWNDIAKALECSIEDAKAGVPTPEQIKAEAERWSDALLAMAAAAEDAEKHGLKKGHGGTGEIECPVCKGRLRYSVASLNGHIWGACSNPECVRWMQ